MPGNGNGGGNGGTITYSNGEGGTTGGGTGGGLTGGEGGYVPPPAPEPEPEPEPVPVVEPEPPPPQRANIDRTSQYSTPDYASMTQTINAMARSSSPEMPAEATDYQLPDTAFGQRLY